MKTVVGALLNFRGAWAAMEPAMHREPHHKPPVHPVLYIKPANTWRCAGDFIVLPPDARKVEVGATLGLVMGSTAARVREADALDHVAGYVIVNDVTVAHSSLLRPPLKHKCRDSFCPMSAVTPASGAINPDALVIRAYVNDEPRLADSTANLVRNVRKLIADVSEFMSLARGDILLVGVPHNAPLARAGDRVAIEIEGLGRLENTLRAEGATA